MRLLGFATLATFKMSLDRDEYIRDLGFWEVDSEGKHVRLVVKEYRYLWKDRVGIRLFDRDRNDRNFAHFSVNIPETKLGPGEFIVKSYSEHRDFWAQMRDFPLFKDTGRQARLPHNYCPIWRLVTHDSYSPARSRMAMIMGRMATKPEDTQFTTATSEELFSVVKRLNSGRGSNESRGMDQLVASMQAHGRQLCLSFVSGQGQSKTGSGPVKAQ